MRVGKNSVDDRLDDLFKNMAEEEAVQSIIAYLAQHHREQLSSELQKLKLMPTILDEYDIAALIDHANLDISQ
jgi:hypothetical protein